MSRRDTSIHCGCSTAAVTQGRFEAGVTDGTFTEVGQRDAPGTGDDVLQGGALKVVRVEAPSGDGTAFCASSGNPLTGPGDPAKLLASPDSAFSRHLSPAEQHRRGWTPPHPRRLRTTNSTNGRDFRPSLLSILSTFAVHLSWNHATWRAPPPALLSRARGSPESVRAFAAAVEVAPATAPVATGRGSESPSTSPLHGCAARRISVRFRDRAVSRTDAFGR